MEKVLRHLKIDVARPFPYFKQIYVLTLVCLFLSRNALKKCLKLFSIVPFVLCGDIFGCDIILAY